MNLEARKRFELERKLDSLTREFDEWIQLTRPQADLEKHHTQVARLSRQLAGLAGVVRERLGQPVTVVAQGRPVEIMILEIHRIWEFFRAKLLQRRMARFASFLQIADELAWTCYAPARALAVAAHTVEEAAVKEPPLVFFNGASSPFTMSRDVSYQAERVPHEDALTTPEFVGVLRALPLPVIGVPWFQVEYLPDMLVIAHEVGHNIEDDFKLTATLHGLVDAAGLPSNRRPAWHAWCGEVFADVYGTLALGPAFVGSLMDFLAASREAVARQRLRAPNWGVYPTDWLRIRVALETLGRGFPAERQELEAEWLANYPSHAMPEFEVDVPAVVSALCTSPLPSFGGARLDAVVPFTAEDQKSAVQGAGDILKPAKLTTTRVPRLLASARLAYARDPAAYDAQSDRVLRHALSIRTPGIRAGRAPVPNISAATDEATGRALFELLAGPSRPDTVTASG